jgi:hypothetical protein
VPYAPRSVLPSIARKAKALAPDPQDHIRLENSALPGEFEPQTESPHTSPSFASSPTSLAGSTSLSPSSMERSRGVFSSAR